jgi:hypothetical protein
MLFYRLLEQSIAADPITYSSLIANPNATGRPHTPPSRPSRVAPVPAVYRPWRQNPANTGGTRPKWIALTRVRKQGADPPAAARAETMGLQAKESVRQGFLGTRTLMQAIELYERHPHAGAAMNVLEAAGALNAVRPEPESDK